MNDRHTDMLGSPVAVTNASGQVTECNDYEPYGAIIGKPTRSGIGYTGHVMDGGTSLTYMQQRYYDQSVGRFLSVDPVTADANVGTNFNRYWYANNSPFKFVDPDGRFVRPTGPFVVDSVRSSGPVGDIQSEAGGVAGRQQPNNASVRAGASGTEGKPQVPISLGTEAKVFVGVYGAGTEQDVQVTQDVFRELLNEGISALPENACVVTSNCHYLGIGLYAGGGVTAAVEGGNISSEDVYVGLGVEGGALITTSGDIDFNSSGVSVGSSAGPGAGAMIGAKVCFVKERSSGCD